MQVEYRPRQRRGLLREDGATYGYGDHFEVTEERAKQLQVSLPGEIFAVGDIMPPQAASDTAPPEVQTLIVSVPIASDGVGWTEADFPVACAQVSQQPVSGTATVGPTLDEDAAKTCVTVVDSAPSTTQTVGLTVSSGPVFPSPNPLVELDGLTRGQLNGRASECGVSEPEGLRTKAEVIEAITAATSDPS